MFLSSFRTKLAIILILCMIIPTTTSGFIAYVTAQRALSNEGMNELEQATVGAVNLAASLQKFVDAGVMTKEQAQEQLRTLLLGPKQPDGSRDLSQARVRVANTGYVTAVDSQGNAVMHPKVEGTNIRDAQGGLGKRMAEMKNGELEYLWKNPGESQAYPKIAYLQYFAPWDWIFMTTAYKDEFQAAANNIKRVIGLIVGVDLVAALLLAWILSRSWTTPIQGASDAVGRLGRGDLTVRLNFEKRKDEFGQLARHFNQAVNGLTELIQEVRGNANLVASASQQLTASAEETGKSAEQIASAAQTVAEEAQKQFMETENLVRVAEQVSEDIKNAEEAVNQVFSLATEAAAYAEDGGGTVDEAVRSIAQVEGKMNYLTEAMDQLNNRLQEIVRIVEIIEGISKQTNLLALNAAVEAARAGEQGRGFAVVAESVRKLAEESAASAKEIGQLTEAIRQDTNGLAVAVEGAVLEVKHGVETVEAAGRTFSGIADNARQAARHMEKAGEQVKQVVGAVSRIVQEIDDIRSFARQTASGTQTVSAATEEQLAVAEQVSASAISLSDTASALQNLTLRFEV
ncbi:methyl-accepting chemotaxis protein [Kyrpidia tusciae]|uniref:Methyl-accepting chemotaxis sensory transducer with Cache sensor n=1 Tax=Kyrpidia tusciae (strain DSM 2912 / NBRC 15312 / T2) TaxID=562970 RepID=D5WVL1_KYRT2|nr:methyl-accepting chemotaxis protein [Kyrpidia tusciae]ADG07554.1 methyl-accepting chemotaxis sensory transducer with Cache sensor [Kyrpidia tusciae DSM 2912]